MAEDAGYLDPHLTVPERVEDLLGRMSLAEKVGQMMQLNDKETVPAAVGDYLCGSILHASPAALAQAQEVLATTRLRIPLIVGEDCIHGHSFFEGATIFPTQLGMAATWDPDLVERAARVTAIEVAPTGVHWTFSPVLCIARDTRWGRVDETFGEDPHLIGELAEAMVRGYQGSGPADPTAIVATAKHFAGYSETLGGRDASEAEATRRKLRSWFLPPFERVARAGCLTFMLGYQAIDGVPITVNRWLLTDVLRGEWDYRGMLVTDWDNVGRLVHNQFLQPDYVAASAAAIRAGNDVIMATPQFFDGAQEAVRRGLATEAQIDTAVRRILALKFQLGLFENPRLPDPSRASAVIGAQEHREVNLALTRRSLVLLRNDGVLPLLPDSGADAPRTIAVVGPNADDAQNQLGDWAGSSGQADWLPDGQPREMITTVLDGLRELAPDNWQVRYAVGAGIVELVADPDPLYPDGSPRPPIALPVPPDADLIEEAVRAASGADAVIAVVGDCVALTGEEKSTATLELMGGQIALLDALAATGVPMVVVVIASKPLVLPASAMGAAAIVWAANPGMRGGQALAELLMGAIEPSGRLPITFPRHAGQLPVYYNMVRGQHGTRYADLTQEPAFYFGEGLSYTTVEYADLRIAEPHLSPSGTVRATVTVANVGRRPAIETVQAYVSDLVTSVTWAERELKAHRLIELAPGESRDVVLDIPVADCSIVDAEGQRVVEPGEFDLHVGPSSRPADLLSARFTVA